MLAWSAIASSALALNAIQLTNTSSGSNCYVRVPGAASLKPEHFTIEVWTKTTGSGFGNTTNGQTIVNMPQEGSTGNFLSPYYLAYDNSTMRYTASIRTGSNSGAAVATSRTFPFNTVVFISLTYDGASLKIYTDGVLDNQVTATGSLFYLSNDLLIGASNFGASFFEGTRGGRRIAHMELCPHTDRDCGPRVLQADRQRAWPYFCRSLCAG